MQVVSVGTQELDLPLFGGSVRGFHRGAVGGRGGLNRFRNGRCAAAIDDVLRLNSSSLGMRKLTPHLGHFAVRPAFSSGQRILCSLGQRNSIIQLS